MAASASFMGGLRADPPQITCTVTLGMRGFTPRETHKDYPEKNFVLRVWHPGFRDFHYVRHADLMRAHESKHMVTFAPMVFRVPRPSKVDGKDRVMYLSENASLGLALFAQTENDSQQDCVKESGSYRRVMLKDVHVNKTTAHGVSRSYEHVVFISECLEGMRVPGTTNVVANGVKATAAEMTVLCILEGATPVFVPSTFGGLGVDAFDARAHEVLRCHMRETQKYHEAQPINGNKMRKYYSLQFKIAEGLALPASAYMLFMMGKDGAPPSPAVVRAMFAAALSMHPEFYGKSRPPLTAQASAEKEWLEVCEEWLASDRAPKDRDPAVTVTFMDALRVAMALLTVYPNSVPYILDMEVDTTGKLKGRPEPFAHAMSAGDEAEVYDEAYAIVQPVECFSSAAMENAGTDCEDYAMYAYWLKNSIQRTYLASMDNILRTLARVYELFVAAVAHMFCKGDDDQLEEDDGVYHFAGYMFPRRYMEECWMRSGANVNLFAKRNAGARAWENDYRDHLGVFILEGTNTVDAAQFRLSKYHEDVRATNATRAATGIRAITDEQTQRRINVYHSYVYPSERQLSRFYRWVCAMFCGETDRENVIDFAFVERGGKCVRVESLAEMSSGVSVHQIQRYEQSTLALCNEVIDLYRPPYRGLSDAGVTQAPELVQCVLSHAPVLSSIIAAAPPETMEARRRNVRVHLQHLDFTEERTPRAAELGKALDEIAIATSATSAQVFANVLGGTWAMPCNLCETASGVHHMVVQMCVIYYY